MHRATDKFGCGLDTIHSLQNRLLPCVVLFKVRITLWKKTSHAWVRQPNTIVVKTLWQGPLQGHGNCSSHCFVISVGKGFPQPPRSPCPSLGHRICHLCDTNDIIYNSDSNNFWQQTTSSSQPDLELTWCFITSVHASCTLSITFITHSQQALFGRAAENGPWWL